MRYPVVVHKDPDSDYGVTVPDLPGCFSAGETLDEALQEVVEPIETHLEGLLMDGEPINFFKMADGGDAPDDKTCVFADIIGIGLAKGFKDERFNLPFIHPVRPAWQ